MPDDTPTLDETKVINTARWLRRAPLRLEDTTYSVPHRHKSKALYIRDRANAKLQGATKRSILALCDAWRALCTLQGISHNPEGEHPSLLDDAPPLETRMQELVDEAMDAVADAPFACDAYAHIYHEVADLVEDEVRECARRVDIEAEAVDTGAPKKDGAGAAQQGSLFDTTRHNDLG